MSREAYGILIGILTIAVILFPLELFVSILTLLTFFISREVSKAVNEENVYYLSPIAFLISYFSLPAGLVFIGIVSLILAYKYWSLEKFFKYHFLLFYPSLFLKYTAHIKEEGTYPLLVFIFGLWVNDVFAYYVGKNLGKTPLFPKISPKKTVEGFLGGIIPGTLLFSFLLPYGFLNSFLIGFLTLLIGVVGDYYKSFIKRQVGIKDFSNIFGEHGGFTDRFDAVVFSSPVYYLLIVGAG